MEEQPNDKSADWQAMAEYWTTVSDIVEGTEAMRAGGKKYLPKFPDESDTDYEFRRKTAKFTNVYRDIVEGLAQKPFAEELSVKDDTSRRIQELCEDIDGRGNHLHVFAGEVFFAGINKALDWILVDHSRSEGARTIADERQAGVRPYWVRIPAERVIWVESAVIRGQEQLTKVKIEEAADRVRTFERNGDTVTWRVEVQSEDVWTIEDQGNVTIGVIPMVPFTTGRRKGSKWQFNPPMRDAADLQVELFQQETALKHIKIMTCFPMLAGNGVDPPTDASGNPQRVPVGPKAVLYAPPNQDGSHGRWEWIGTDASTLKFLSDDVAKTAAELRELGRQPLTSQSANLTVIATAFASAKGNSAAQAWALLLKDALENALYITSLWLNAEEKPEVRIFTDFGIDDVNDKSPEYLLTMRENGDLSQATLWEEFKRRGVLGSEFDPEAEVEERMFNELPNDDEETRRTAL